MKKKMNMQLLVMFLHPFKYKNTKYYAKSTIITVTIKR